LRDKRCGKPSCLPLRFRAPLIVTNRPGARSLEAPIMTITVNRGGSEFCNGAREIQVRFSDGPAEYDHRSHALTIAFVFRTRSALCRNLLDLLRPSVRRRLRLPILRGREVLLFGSVGRG